MTPAQMKKRRTTRNKWVRAGIQLVFFLSMPGAFVAGFNGVKQVFERIGSGQSLEWNGFTMALVGLCVFTIIFGRFFCGYVCAFGSLGDGIYALSGLIQKKLFKAKKQFKLPLSDKAIHILQKVKFVILAAIVVLSVLGIYSNLAGWSPWTVFSFITSLKFRLAGYVAGTILLVIIIAGMAVRERFFCQFLCPMGAIFAILPQLPFANLKRNPAQCIKGCKACQMNCPVNIKLETDGFLNGECIGCERCADICPKQNLTRWDRKLMRNEAVAAIVKAILFFIIGAWLGLCRFF